MPLTIPIVDVLIIGAGPTGLGAATRLDQIHCDNWVLFERNSKAGGLASTDETPEGFLFDIGGHVIFSHYEYFDKLLETNMGKFEDEAFWRTHQRVSYVRYKGVWVPFPFQNNLCRIPAEDQVKAIVGMVDAKVEDARLGPSRPPPTNFDEWIVRTMGTGLAEMFMRPYNFKVWAIPPNLMQWGWLGERVSVVDTNRAIEGTILKKEKEDVSWGPNATFRFPARGGTGSIWKSIASRLPLEKLNFNCEVTSIDLVNRQVVVKHLANGGATQIIGFHRIINTMPLDIFLDRLTSESINDQLRSEIKSGLVHSSTHVVGLGIRGSNPHGSKCWIYFPEDNCPFYRATIFSNYSPHNCPPEAKLLPTLRRADGKSFQPKVGPGPWWSLMLEVSESKEYKPVDLTTIIDDTIKGGVASGLLRHDDEIVSIHHRRIEYGYPTPSLFRDEALKVALPLLQAKGVWSRGRFGCFKYEVGNQDHSLALGVETVDNIYFGSEETTLDRSGYVNRAVGSAKNPKPEFDCIPVKVTNDHFEKVATTTT